MDHRILSWNIRGLGQYPKIIAIKAAIAKYNPTICTIQETKTEVVDDSLIRSLWGSNRCSYIYLASEGAYGGIIFMWKERILVMEDQLIGAFSVSIKFRNMSDDFSWIFTSVYGASDSGYYSSDERNTQGGGVANINYLKAFVQKFALIDIPMAGGRFTWTNSKQPPLLIRLDRFPLCPDFINHCHSPMQVRLRRPISDHAPIMLHCNFGESLKSPFRLDNFILHHPEFLTNLRIWWDNLSFTGTPSFIFAKKLQGLKFLIKNWQKSTFGNLNSQIENLDIVINALDNLEELATLSDAEVVEREQAKLQHASLSLNVARRAAQRAKEKWAKDGEKNSAYLHQIANFKYKLNSIKFLKINGALCFDKNQIAEETNLSILLYSMRITRLGLVLII
ncbi:uncharacterized protein LOC113315972 [Papaver somniferum]|uniref:uncharacterized protein LOC113315972 n=1 Tax=Papaver somniferum TaxID=3469 RepID=UPI000E6F7358|nr:uncharacterized protein LOC113315972 [Papaver somniferum]